MMTFVLSLRKHVSTLARVPLKIKAVVNYLMSAFFVVIPGFALDKQTNKQTKNFSPYTSNPFLFKSTIMKTILLSLGKSLVNILSVFCTLISSLFSFDGENGTVNTFTREPSKTRKAGIMKMMAAFLVSLISASLKAKNKLLNMPFLIAKNSFIKTDLPLVKRNISDIINPFTSLLSFFSGAYKTLNTRSRTPLGTPKAGIIKLMSVLFVLPGFAPGKQTNKQTKNFSPYTSNPFLFKSTIMKTILLSLGKSLVNILSVFCTLISSLFSFDGENGTVNTFTREPSKTRKAGIMKMMAAFLVSLISASLKAKNKLLNMPFLIAKNSFIKTNLPLVKRNTSDIMNPFNSLLSFFSGAYKTLNTRSRTLLGIQKAGIIKLMSVLFVLPGFAPGKQTNKQTKNFSPYTSNPFLFKSTIMKTILLSLGKSLANILSVFCTLISSLFRFDGENGTVNTFTSEPSISASRKAKNKLLNMPLLTAKNSFIKTNLPLVKRNTSDIMNPFNSLLSFFSGAYKTVNTRSRTLLGIQKAGIIKLM